METGASNLKFTDEQVKIPFKKETILVEKTNFPTQASTWMTKGQKFDLKNWRECDSYMINLTVPLYLAKASVNI